MAGNKLRISSLIQDSRANQLLLEADPNAMATGNASVRRAGKNVVLDSAQTVTIGPPIDSEPADADDGMPEQGTNPFLTDTSRSPQSDREFRPGSNKNPRLETLLVGLSTSEMQRLVGVNSTVEFTKTYRDEGAFIINLAKSKSYYLRKSPEFKFINKNLSEELESESAKYVSGLNETLRKYFKYRRFYTEIDLSRAIIKAIEAFSTVGANQGLTGLSVDIKAKVDVNLSAIKTKFPDVSIDTPSIPKPELGDLKMIEFHGCHIGVPQLSLGSVIPKLGIGHAFSIATNAIPYLSTAIAAVNVAYTGAVLLNLEMKKRDNSAMAGKFKNSYLMTAILHARHRELNYQRNEKLPDFLLSTGQLAAGIADISGIGAAVIGASRATYNAMMDVQRAYAVDAMCRTINERLEALCQKPDGNMIELLAEFPALYHVFLPSQAEIGDGKFLEELGPQAQPNLLKRMHTACSEAWYRYIKSNKLNFTIRKNYVGPGFLPIDYFAGFVSDLDGERIVDMNQKWTGKREEDLPEMIKFFFKLCNDSHTHRMNAPWILAADETLLETAFAASGKPIQS